MNVSHCYSVTGLHSRLFDPVLGLKSLFFTWTTTSAERVRQQTLFVGSSVCLFLFCSFFFFHPHFVSLCLNLSSRFRLESEALITIKRSVHSFTYCTLTQTYAFRHTLSLSISPSFSLPFFFKQDLLVPLSPYRHWDYISHLHVWYGNSKRGCYGKAF